MNPLSQFLKKIGVSSFQELNEEEKKTYREWEVSLSGRRITEDDYRAFLETELELAIARLTDVDLKAQDEIFRKVEVRFIKKVLNFLDMPKLEKALLENQLAQKTNE